MTLLFNILPRFVIDFLPRSKHLLISWLQSPCAVILESKNSVSLFPLFPHLFAMKWWTWMPWSWFFEYWVFCQLFLSPFHFHKRLFSSSLISIPVFLPGESHGQRSLVGYSPQDCKELDITEQLTLLLFTCFQTILQYLLITLHHVQDHKEEEFELSFPWITECFDMFSL